LFSDPLWINPRHQTRTLQRSVESAGAGLYSELHPKAQKQKQKQRQKLPDEAKDQKQRQQPKTSNNGHTRKSSKGRVAPLLRWPMKPDQP
jgi:hypothetical protein